MERTVHAAAAQSITPVVVVLTTVILETHNMDEECESTTDDPESSKVESTSDAVPVLSPKDLHNLKELQSTDPPTFVSINSSRSNNASDEEDIEAQDTTDCSTHTAPKSSTIEITTGGKVPLRFKKKFKFDCNSSLALLQEVQHARAHMARYGESEERWREVGRRMRSRGYRIGSHTTCRDKFRRLHKDF